MYYFIYLKMKGFPIIFAVCIAVLGITATPNNQDI